MKLKRNSGITLVALVVTIIVLLILAGVTLSLALNSNGVLQRSKNAARVYKEAEDAEREELSRVEETFEDLAPMTEEQKAKAEQIKSASNIGNKVNYVAKKDNTLVWRLYYADDNWVYLISTKADGTNVETEIKVDDYINNYPNGTAHITDTNLKSTLSMWFAAIENTESKVSKEYNAKCTAYMMDQEVWKDYKDAEGNAKYAMAGPTIEMLRDSYNKAANGEKRIRVECNEYGYTIYDDNDLSSSYNNGIYNNTNAYTGYTWSLYWIIAPTRVWTQNVEWKGTAIKVIAGMTNSTIARFYDESYSYSQDVRPVVMIPMKKFINAGYTITNE